MATSESDDFESADEELINDASLHKSRHVNAKPSLYSSTAVDSESDDDTEFVPRVIVGRKLMVSEEEPQKHHPFRTKLSSVFEDEKKVDNDKEREAAGEVEVPERKSDNESRDTKTIVFKEEEDRSSSKSTLKATDREEFPSTEIKVVQEVSSVLQEVDGRPSAIEEARTTSKLNPVDRRPAKPRRRPEDLRKPGTKKLGVKVEKKKDSSMLMADVRDAEEATIKRKDEVSFGENECKRLERLGLTEPDENDRMTDSILEQFSRESNDYSGKSDTLETDTPEELRSNKRFKDVFEPQGWEEIGNDIELSEDLTKEKIQPVFDRLSLKNEDSESGWGDWGGWGVSSLINTATASVSTLTSHVSQGLTLLEETIGVPDVPESSAVNQQDVSATNDEESNVQTSTSQGSFGFGNLFSGVSSITKLVESTGTKVMTGGLDTLEAIGKKTMEVLQEGDPGLKKKRAFFAKELNKPNLSQILKEAKEKAEMAEKHSEEKHAKKIHFGTFFDDYQGLVHLEVLEMLSKQSDMKIERYLTTIDTSQLNSVQETLEEVKELCDLKDEDDNEQTGESEKDLKSKLSHACKDLGVDITYDKLDTIWCETKTYLAQPIAHTDEEIFQNAISMLAKFTALCMERFHKTAELLLIKERRSTVNEADALVQLTHILSSQVDLLAHAFCNALQEFTKIPERVEYVNANITTIFLEAENATSCVQDAFKLLIPILQVGAI